MRADRQRGHAPRRVIVVLDACWPAPLPTSSYDTARKSEVADSAMRIRHDISRPRRHDERDDTSARAGELSRKRPLGASPPSTLHYRAGMRAGAPLTWPLTSTVDMMMMTAAFILIIFITPVPRTPRVLAMSRSLYPSRLAYLPATAHRRNFTAIKMKLGALR